MPKKLIVLCLLGFFALSLLAVNSALGFCLVLPKEI